MVGWALALALLMPMAAWAQSGLFSAPPSGGLTAPNPATRGNVFTPDSVLAKPPNAPLAMPPAAAAAAIPMVPAGQAALALSARFGKDAGAITGGLNILQGKASLRILESYPDGVPGWSGSDNRILPSVGTGDSITVRFTPPRAGTHPPTYPNPPPRAVTGTFSRDAN